MDLNLAGKVFMVAASSKGLGHGIARAVASEGAKVSLASRSADGITSAAKSIQDVFSVEARGYTLDASKAESITAWTDATLQDFGRIDGLVVNAGGPPPGKFPALDDSMWQQGFELTLMSAVRMIRSVLPIMQKQKSGSILTITSTSVKEPIEVLLLSNVFRSGVVSLVKSLSYDLAEEGIRINNLVPGRIDTERVQTLDELAAKKRGISVEVEREGQCASIPLGRYGLADEFGRAGAFLLSDAASYITGATLVVDGGKTRSVW